MENILSNNNTIWRRIFPGLIKVNLFRMKGREETKKPKIGRNSAGRRCNHEVKGSPLEEGQPCT